MKLLLGIIRLLFIHDLYSTTDFVNFENMNLPKFINTFNYNLENGLILEKIEHPSFLEMSNFKLYNKDYSFLKCSFVNEFYFSDSHKNLHLCYNIFNSKLKDVRDTTNMNIHNFLHFNDSGITFNFILENESRFLSFNSYSFNLKISVPIIKITNLNLYAMNRYKEKNGHTPQSLMRYVHFQKNFDRSYKNYSNINNSNYVTLIEHGVTRNNNTFIKDNVKIHINVANHVINREKSVLNVIFTLMEVKNIFYFDVKQRNSHKKGLWCAFIYAENINENLVSNCILEYVFSNNTVYFGGASCLTSLNIPTSWWKNSQSQSNYVAKTFKLFYSIQYHVIENECLKPNFGKRFFLSIISLSNEYSFYNQIENAKFIIQMPQNSFKPTQKVYTILKYTDKLSNFKDTRLIIKSQEGVKIEMIENKNPSIWDINFKIYNKKLAAVVDISLKENYDSYTSKSLKTISEIILRVDKKDNYTEKSNNNYSKIVSVLFKTINLEPKEKKLIEVRVKNHSFKVLKDSAFKKDTDLKKDDPNVFTAHIKINHDSITNIIPIVNNKDIVNLAIFSKKIIFRNIVIYAIDDNNRIFNIKNDYCKCYSTNEDALKVVKSCSNVYVDGTEKHGSSLVTIILRCKNITKLIVFKVWFPLIPLSIHLSDPYLSKIIDKSESNGTIDLKKCEIVYQISKITVTASFSTSEILSDKFNIDVTNVVKDLFTLSDNIARIENQFLIPHSPGSSNVQIFYKNMKIGSQYFFVSNKDHVTTNSLDFIPFNDLFISTHSNSTSMGEHYIFVKSKLIERPTVNKSKMLFWVTFSDNTMIELNKNSPYSKIYDISIQSSNNSVVNIVNNELNFINPGKSNIVINIYTKRICEFSNSLYKKFSSLKTISPNKNRKTKFQLKNDQSPSINLNENQKKFSILIFQNNSHIYLINENVGSVDLDSPKELIFSVKSWNRNFDQVDIEQSFSGQNVLTNMISSQKNNKINQEVSFVKSNMGRIVIYSLVCIFLLVSCVFSIYIILLIIHHCKKIKLNNSFIFKNCETPQYNKHDNYFNSTKRYNKSFLTNSINLPNIKSSYPHVPSQSAHTVKYSNYKCKPNTTDSGFSTNQNVSQKETIRKMNRWIKKNYFIENTNFSHYPSIDFNTQYDVYNK